MKISTDWLKDFIDLKPPIPAHADALTEAGLEVESIEKSASGDSVFTVEVTSNRPDWLSHLGVARELSAIHGLALGKPVLMDEKKLSRTPPPGWRITCKDAEACPYYSGVLIEGITEHKIPEFIQKRLESCGLRSVSLIVDITNYVLLELGQPLHAFDADLLTGQQIIVRRARKGEKLNMISGSALELSEEDLVIADEEKALALAGVMGGKDTEISPRTRNIFLESAHFQPRTVRESARRHMLSTDSSYRFERRVDPCLAETARLRALYLIMEYAKPRHVSGVLQFGSKPNPVLTSLHLSEDQVKNALGCEVKANQIPLFLNRLGLEVKTVSPKSWKVNIPSFRADLTRPIDLVEEVARLFGFNNIPETLPVLPPGMVSPRPDQMLQRTLRSTLSGAGFHEAVTFSIISSQGFSEEETANMVHLRNPLQTGWEWMRPTLLPGLLQAVQKNIRHGAASIPLFEIAHVYHLRGGKDADEIRSLGIILTGTVPGLSWLDKPRQAVYSDLKGVVQGILNRFGVQGRWEPFSSFGLARGACETLTAGTARPVFIGQVSAAWMKLWDLKSPVFYAEINLPQLLQASVVKRTYSEISRYPAVERDLSITVPENVACSQVESDIREAGGRLVTRIELFDLFQGGRVASGHKNLSFRLTYSSPEKTLTAEEVDAQHSQIAAALVRKYQAQFQAG